MKEKMKTTRHEEAMVLLITIYGNKLTVVLIMVSRFCDVCSMIWCGNGEGIIRSSHPALEGSYCGSSKSDVVLDNAVNQGKIRMELTAYKIKLDMMYTHQSAISASSPNNGGFKCKGGSVRGVRSKTEVCSGLSVEEYATEICSHLRNNGNASISLYSGEGIQFIQSPCKVWCVLSKSNNIRTVSNFPDGTPCAEHQYCIKGECMPLLCNGSTITASTLDCVLRSSSVEWSVSSSCVPGNCGQRGEANAHITDAKPGSLSRVLTRCLISCESRGYPLVYPLPVSMSHSVTHSPVSKRSCRRSPIPEECKISSFLTVGSPHLGKYLKSNLNIYIYIYIYIFEQFIDCRSFLPFSCNISLSLFNSLL
uniref:ADAM_CR_2 domain-containing protein n=1 Tax=Heterorhabditis bacteriophora TaxID=37862 RepID=A0A1I7WA44_HETBA